jgi:hypothetical protein
MKASVAYEASRRQKPHVKQLKWHLMANGLMAENGVKGIYYITKHKPNRRIGEFKWGLSLQKPGAPYAENVVVNGKPISLDDRSELKAFASSYDAIPSGTVIAVNEANERAGETCKECGHAKESPTREEWEVIVTSPPPAHRGAILAMGLGETQEVGNKIILRGFHDDEQAARTAGAIARTYKVGVTFGPRNALYEAAEGAAAEEARLTAARRDALPDIAFALPDRREFPINDAAHVRNAAARLEAAHNDGRVTDAEYHRAKKRIARAAHHFGIHSEYAAEESNPLD